jgi:hypothetical protein
MNQDPFKENLDHYTRNMAKTQAIVEATRFEQLALWRNWHEETGWPWVEDLSGYGINVGECAGLPVFVSISWATIKNRHIMFIEATSQVVDYRLIDAWIEENFPNAPKTNACNFGHAFP